MFEKTLIDLIKGIRGNKEHEDEFIRKSLSEIKDEVKSTDMFVKAQAIQKLTYVCLPVSPVQNIPFILFYSLFS